MKTKTVLIVEDNNLNRKLYESLIAQVTPCVSAKNGIQALSYCLESKFDLILMDIQLPQIDGITTMRRIRKETPQNCPIIAISAFAKPQDRAKFINIGFDEFLLKPIKPKDFLLFIENFLHEQCGNSSDQNPTNQADLILDRDTFSQLSKFNNTQAVKAVYDDFVLEMDTLTKLIHQLLQEGNLEEIAKNLHTIKGNSGTLGANTIYKISSEAEQFALDHNWPQLEEAIQMLNCEKKIFEEYIKDEKTFEP
ncbi:response regulator [Algoriphagus halophytocola]|uniref:response regulator n=1 Tax=Algoriphagus halophytocola TaxID=2991499 RepID=UPI0022DE1951|nr:response regulator [Algoriphagus sp. TR-M9]WBL41377.1 response regulator [Algoriphagus sp. TR-M9]